MGEHGTWFDFLNRIGGWTHFAGPGGTMDHSMGRKWEWLLFGPSTWTVTHMLVAVLVVLFTIYGAMKFYAGFKSQDKGLLPPRKMNLRNFFEYTAEMVYGMVEGALGEHHAKKFFPLIGALWIFILFGNLIGLVPGFVSPNDTLKTNVGLAVLVFLVTHVYGVKEHGLGYFKHFLGPNLALAPLMLPIEIISHLARPLSLSLRLMGNMVADHKVVFAFFTMVPLVVPLPFMLLGLLVCLIQAIVFCTLTMVYIGMAVEHEEH